VDGALKVWPTLRTGLYVVDGGGLGTLAFTDLLCSEPASANAAAPTRRLAYRCPRQSLSIGTPGLDQLATALWTLSLNH